MSWLSLPSNNHHDEHGTDGDDAHHQRLSSLSPVSRPQSSGFDVGPPASRDATSSRHPNENDGLLQAGHETTRHPSISSSGIDSSLNKAPRVMAFDTPAKERECCVNDRFVLHMSSLLAAS
jgi:hypothetical protein